MISNVNIAPMPNTSVTVNTGGATTDLQQWGAAMMSTLKAKAAADLMAASGDTIPDGWVATGDAASSYDARPDAGPSVTRLPAGWGESSQLAQAPSVPASHTLAGLRPAVDHDDGQTLSNPETALAAEETLETTGQQFANQAGSHPATSRGSAQQAARTTLSELSENALLAEASDNPEAAALAADDAVVTSRAQLAAQADTRSATAALLKAGQTEELAVEKSIQEADTADTAGRTQVEARAQTDASVRTDARLASAAAQAAAAAAAAAANASAGDALRPDQALQALDIWAAAAGLDGGMTDQVGILSSFILNAAMIPGWPAPKPFELLLGRELIPQKGVAAFDEAEILKYLANMGADAALLSRLKKLMDKLGRKLKIMLGLAILLTAATTALATLKEELAALVNEHLDEEEDVRRMLTG